MWSVKTSLKSIIKSSLPPFETIRSYGRCSHLYFYADACLCGFTRTYFSSNWKFEICRGWTLFGACTTSWSALQNCGMVHFIARVTSVTGANFNSSVFDILNCSTTLLINTDLYYTNASIITVILWGYEVRSTQCHQRDKFQVYSWHIFWIHKSLYIKRKFIFYSIF